MKRYLSSLLLVIATGVMSACSSDDNGTSDAGAFNTIDTTVLSRGVAIPVTFVTPGGSEGDSFPLVVMAHGHGGSRQEGGGYEMMAAALAAAGVATVRMDFPGCGDSTESFTENNLTNMLLDLQAAREFAAAKDEIDADRIGLLGYSMGGRLVALLSARDPSYKVMAMWTPAVADGAMREVNSLGGPDAYYALREQARETGMAAYTTRWGQELQLGYQWFVDLENTKPLESLASFEGSLLVLYGDKDDVVVPATSEAAIAAATSSREVVRHVIAGAEHGLGFYTERPEFAAEVVATTAEFFAKRL